MTLMERIALQRLKLESAIDALEAARMNEGITGGMLLWLRGELREIDEGIGAIEYAIAHENGNDSDSSGEKYAAAVEAMRIYSSYPVENSVVNENEKER